MTNLFKIFISTFATILLSLPAHSQVVPIGGFLNRCASLAARAASFLRTSRPPLAAWSDTDWAVWDALAKRTFTDGVKAAYTTRFQTRDPLIIRDLEKLREFGVPIDEVKPGSYVIRYADLDWRKFSETCLRAKIPFHPRISLTPKGSGVFEYANLGFGPIPNALRIGGVSYINHDAWAKEMGSGIYPFSLELVHHDLFHLITYSENLEYANELHQMYRSGRGRSVPKSLDPHQDLTAVEEIGGIVFTTSKENAAKFVKENRQKMIKNPRAFLQELAPLLKKHAPYQRQLAPLDFMMSYGGAGVWRNQIRLMQRPGLLAEDRLNQLREKSQKSISEATLAEVYRSLVFFSDLKEEPELVNNVLMDFVRRTGQGAHNNNDLEVSLILMEDLKKKDPVAFNAMLEQALADLHTRMVHLTAQDASYSDALLRILRSIE